MTGEEFREKFLRAAEFRKGLFLPPFEEAFRLVNGFTEGLPDLAVDILAKTAVIHDYSAEGTLDAEAIRSLLLEALPNLKAVVLKRRASESASARNGILIHGVRPDDRIREHGVRYAVDPLLNRDDSFYPDTRFLREWLIENSRGKRVLNTFAYTGSLGTAAYAGGAAEVLQTDLSDKFLDLGRRSYTLNGFYFNRKSFLAEDFFRAAGKLRRENRKFDCVILDPPFFSKTDAGTVDLAANPLAPVNKVRPLTAEGGALVVVNNSLYLSGRDFLDRIDALCDGIHLTREAILPVPSDFTGPEPDYGKSSVADPAPFNHPTKIVILRTA